MTKTPKSTAATRRAIKRNLPFTWGAETDALAVALAREKGIKVSELIDGLLTARMNKLEEQVQQLSTEAAKRGVNARTITITLPDDIAETCEAIAFIMDRSVEDVVLDSMSGILADDKENPAELFHWCVSAKARGKERLDAVARFKQYRDKHELDFSDSDIKVSLAGMR